MAFGFMLANEVTLITEEWEEGARLQAALDNRRGFDLALGVWSPVSGSLGHYVH